MAESRVRARGTRSSVTVDVLGKACVLGLCWLLSGLLGQVHGWQYWTYTKNVTEEWQELWGWDEGPHGRRGHSMVLAETKIILFGGRDNEKYRNHAPRSYEVKDVNGSLEFE